MEVDADAALDGFLSDVADVRRRAAEALERWRLRDAGGLIRMLAARAGTAGNATELRALAAVLLRKVLIKSQHEVTGKEGWCRPGMSEIFLEMLALAVADKGVSAPAADAVAIAASIQFTHGHCWPELLQLLARWCLGGRQERAATLRILEQLTDESECSIRPRPSADNVEVALPAGRPGATVLLTLAEDHGNALRSLLEAALRDNGDEASRDSAARIYTQCVTSSKALPPLRIVLHDLEAVLAEAAATPSVSSTAPAGDSCAQPSTVKGGGLSEACLQAVALAVRADPSAWVRLAVHASGLPAEAALPSALISVMGDTRAAMEVRSAALAALLELTDAVHCSAEAGDNGSMSGADHLVDAASRATAAVLAEVPADEATDAWAETLEDEVDPAEVDENDEDGLFEAALDAIERLASFPRRCCGSASEGSGSTGLVTAAEELLASAAEAWQTHHAALLICLRLAFASPVAAPAGAASAAATAALGHFSHVHPRVRWAALEVWARLLTAEPDPQALRAAPSCEDFASAFDTLVAIVNDDPYMRVRRHGLLVFVAAATSATPPFSILQVKPLFYNVLIPQVASPDVAVREACATIARGIVTACSQQATEQVPGTVGADEMAAGLWAEFCEAAAAVQQQLHVELDAQNAQIEWPADWRKIELGQLD